MAEKPKNVLGPAGEALMRNVKRIREERRLTFVELSERLGALDRPIPVLGLRRIERGERRVDVDDLFAFAKIFGVSPLALVTDGDPEDQLSEARAVLYSVLLEVASALPYARFWDEAEFHDQLTDDQLNSIERVRRGAADMQRALAPQSRPLVGAGSAFTPEELRQISAKAKRRRAEIEAGGDEAYPDEHAKLDELIPDLEQQEREAREEGEEE